MSDALVAITRAIPLRGLEIGTPPRITGARVVMAPAEPQMSRPQLLAFVRGARAIISMFHDKVDAEFLDAAGPQVRGVCNFAVGVDNIDMPLCASRGVTVTNTPDAVTEGTANLTVGLIIAVARRMLEGDQFVRSGGWERQGNTFPSGWMGMHLFGQTLLIVGAGRIGRAVAQRALAFGMRVLYVARSHHPEFDEGPINARRVDLADGLRSADVVSIHTPLTPETRHILNAKNIPLLKPTAIVINTSRGPTIEESALFEALRARRIWGAGLDVLEHEPRAHPGLTSLNNVVLTPHIGSGERYWREEMSRMALDNAAAVVAGRKPPNAVSAPSRTGR